MKHTLLEPLRRRLRTPQETTFPRTSTRANTVYRITSTENETDRALFLLTGDGESLAVLGDLAAREGLVIGVAKVGKHARGWLELLVETLGMQFEPSMNGKQLPSDARTWTLTWSGVAPPEFT